MPCNLKQTLIILVSITVLSGKALAQENMPPLFKECNDPLISLSQRQSCSEEMLRAYIERKLEYPDSSSLRGIEGVAVAKFTVDTEGKVTTIEIIKGIDKYCNTAVLTVLKSLPSFSPALENGQAIEAKLTIPIRFHLKKLLHQKEEDFYTLHWAHQKEDSINRKILQKMLDNVPFIRDAKGRNHTIEKLELTYIKGRKIRNATNHVNHWTPESVEFLKKVRRGGILMLRAETTHQYKTIEVIREYYITN